eukprot:186820_1
MTSASSITAEIDSIISILETPTDYSSKSQRSKASLKEEKEEKKEEKCSERIAGTSLNDKSLDLDRRVEIAASVGEECITKEELRTLSDKKLTRPIAYDGFEPSGRMHIAQGILKAINVNKLTSVG